MISRLVLGGMFEFKELDEGFSVEQGDYWVY